jgi:hypothetical protein
MVWWMRLLELLVRDRRVVKSEPGNLAELGDCETEPRRSWVNWSVHMPLLFFNRLAAT